MTKAPERPDLDDLIEKSKKIVAKMTPEEKDAMLKEQGKNWAAAEAKLDK